MRLSREYGCPVELSLEVLGGKWRSVILARLKGGPRRYGELRRAIPDLSDKMLSQRLRELEDSGLVERIEGAGARSYALSARGRSLQPVLQSLYDWGLSVADELDVAFRDGR